MASKSTQKGNQKEIPRSEELQEDVKLRLSKAIGQLNGIKNMIDDNRYCGDVLMQLAAVEKAIQKVSRIILQNHLETCVTMQIRRGDEEAVEEVMTLLRQFG